MSDAKDATPPKKRTGPITFIKQVQAEGRKVTWTSRKETMMASVMVVIMVMIAAVFFYFTDAVVGFLVRFLTQTGGL